MEINFPDRNYSKADVSQEAKETEETEIIINDYPDAIGSDDEKLFTPLLPDEVFISTAEENGLDGTVYQILGTVKEITADAHGNMTVIHLHTHKGDLVIENIALSMVDDQSFSELGDIDLDVINSLCPMPQKGEFCRIYAEYQGYSEKYQTPYFIYGGIEYLTDVIINSLE